MATDIRDPNDPLVYRGGELPEVVVEADRPYNLFFRQFHDGIVDWQERNLYNQDYSGASDWIGAGLGMVGSEVARAATNLLSLGEYAAREILPSGITGRPARRYRAYESNPASYALTEAAMDVAPVPIVDDALRLAGRAAARNATRNATRTAARNLSEQVVRQGRRFNPADETWDRDPFSMIGQMTDAERAQFADDVMAESANNWKNYYQANPQRENQIIDLYTKVGVDERDARYLADVQKQNQMYPNPNIMVHDYGFYGPSMRGGETFLPRIKSYLDQMVDRGAISRSAADRAYERQLIPENQQGFEGQYHFPYQSGKSVPRRDTILHEAVHGVQGNLGIAMNTRGMNTNWDDIELARRASMSNAELIDQAVKDMFTPANAYAQYQRLLADGLNKNYREFRGSLPWDKNTGGSENIVYSYYKNNKEETMSALGLKTDDDYSQLLEKIRSRQAPKYFSDPLEIAARVNGQFAERVLRDKSKFDFLEDIDPYNLPEYRQLSQKQRDYMYNNFFKDKQRQSDFIQGAKFMEKGVAEEILVGAYNIPFIRNLTKDLEIYKEFTDILPNDVLWEMFRNVTRSVPAVAAGTTAAGYGVASGRNQSPDNKKK